MGAAHPTSQFSVPEQSLITNPAPLLSPSLLEPVSKLHHSISAPTEQTTGDTSITNHPKAAGKDPAGSWSSWPCTPQQSHPGPGFPPCRSSAMTKLKPLLLYPAQECSGAAPCGSHKAQHHRPGEMGHTFPASITKSFSRSSCSFGRQDGPP